VSTSGEINSPPSSTSSPVFAITVVSSGEKEIAAPSRSFGVPVPPERNVTIPPILDGGTIVLTRILEGENVPNARTNRVA